MNEFMNKAIQEAYKGVKHNHGGPFGAVIVKNGKVIASGHNKVVLNNDPTCHGEIDAIRKACKKLHSFDLTGCDLYTTGEPCTMCLCACLWANISNIYYGCTIQDNSFIGFRDEKFDNIFSGRDLIKNMYQIDYEECKKLFDDYNQLKSCTKY